MCLNGFVRPRPRVPHCVTPSMRAVLESLYSHQIPVQLSGLNQLTDQLLCPTTGGHLCAALVQSGIVAQLVRLCVPSRTMTDSVSGQSLLVMTLLTATAPHYGHRVTLVLDDVGLRLVQAMPHCPPALLRPCILALCCLVQQSLLCRVYLLHQGILDPLFRVLATNDDPETVADASVMLTALTHHPFFPHGHFELVQCALATLFTLLARDECAVVEQACLSLANLCHSTDDHRNTVMATANGALVRVVVQLLNQSSVAVNTAALAVLCELSAGDHCRPKHTLVQAGVFGALAQLLGQLPNTEVATHACRCVANVLTGEPIGPSRLQPVLDSGLIPVMVRIQHTTPTINRVVNRTFVTIIKHGNRAQLNTLIQAQRDHLNSANNTHTTNFSIQTN